MGSRVLDVAWVYEWEEEGKASGFLETCCKRKGFSAPSCTADLNSASIPDASGVCMPCSLSYIGKYAPDCVASASKLRESRRQLEYSVCDRRIDAGVATRSSRYTPFHRPPEASSAESCEGAVLARQQCAARSAIGLQLVLHERGGLRGARQAWAGGPGATASSYSCVLPRETRVPAATDGGTAASRNIRFIPSKRTGLADGIGGRARDHRRPRQRPPPFPRPPR